MRTGTRKLRFNGVAVYPRQVGKLKVVTIGLWTTLVMSEREKLALAGVFRYFVRRLNVCAVLETRSGTTVQVVLRVTTANEARLAAVFLSRLYRHLTGATVILRELPTVETVRRALSVR